MAAAKEIRNQIRSIKNTQKITRAMEMVAASKMRKAQSRMRAARPYAERIRRVIAHVSAASTEYVHPFMVEREPKSVGYIVVSTDRGLCGGLNSNVFRAMLGELDRARTDGLFCVFLMLRIWFRISFAAAILSPQLSGLTRRGSP